MLLLYVRRRLDAAPQLRAHLYSIVAAVGNDHEALVIDGHATWVLELTVLVTFHAETELMVTVVIKHLKCVSM